MSTSVAESSIHTYLTQHYCRPTLDWIRSILQTESSPPSIYQRFLQLDWSQSTFKQHSVVALPPGFTPNDPANFEEKYLTGRYLLQVVYAVDVSKPLAYEFEDDLETDDDAGGSEDEESATELGKMMKKGHSKAVDAAKKAAAKANEDPFKYAKFGARMLQLGLTDGQQTYIAMEYKPIPALNVEQIGAKILVSGPVEVRVGTLMLRPENVQVIYEVPAEERQVRLQNGGPMAQEQRRPPPQPVSIAVPPVTLTSTPPFRQPLQQVSGAVVNGGDSSQQGRGVLPNNDNDEFWDEMNEDWL